MVNTDLTKHVRGESIFIDDIPVPVNTVYLSILFSPLAHGKIKKIILDEAIKVPGVKKIFTAKDIPGKNQIGGIVLDELLLAEDEVTYVGQPVAVVAAETQLIARIARNKIKVEIEKLKAITDPREAFAAGELIIPPKIFSSGNIETAWKDCDVIVDGTTETGGQEHIYMETQVSLAFPIDGEGIKIFSSTQGPTVVQRIAARVLDLPMNKVEVDVPRIGGGFGGKEDQANAWAAITALAAFNLKCPAKLVLPREEDIRVTGKRHPYSSDFKIGLDKDGKILAYEFTFYQNAGAAADLSPAILDRTLFHAANSYFIPNLKATGLCCRTNLPPNTAFRGFGGPQGMFVIEAAIFKAAQTMGIEPDVIQQKNLLKEGDSFHYGQNAVNCTARLCWQSLDSKFQIKEIKDSIAKFNSSNTLLKKGMALMPICFGISFTNTFMNQASVLVHIYSDGSVGISSAAVEMGQGINAKLRQIAAKIFSVEISRIKIESSNTTRVANASPTAASSSTDLNGKALLIACNTLLERLLKSAKEDLNLKENSFLEIKNEIVYSNGNPTKSKWIDIVNSAFLKRVNLSTQAQYATPGIYFDKEISKGNAFAYHVYGTAIIETTLDCLRGIYRIDSVKVVHDFGKSFNKQIDIGQAEGGIVQGLGWITIEDIIFDHEGKLATNSFSNYKIPDIHFAPEEMLILPLENSTNPSGVFNSKAIGEPPLMYGIGVFFALANAMKAFRPNINISFSAPLTPEKVMLKLYSRSKEKSSNYLSQ